MNLCAVKNICIINMTLTWVFLKNFPVCISDAMPTKVSVKVGEPVILQHNITDINMYDVIEWMFEDGETAIARINKQISKNPSYDEKNEKFRGRLALDQTGYLTITDSKTTDSGLYKLEVIGTNLKGNRNFRVVVSGEYTLLFASL